MPKYLIEAAYTAEGLRGLQKDKASGRRQALAKAVESLEGKLEAFYFSMGARRVGNRTPAGEDDGAAECRGSRPRAREEAQLPRSGRIARVRGR